MEKEFDVHGTTASTNENTELNKNVNLMCTYFENILKPSETRPIAWVKWMKFIASDKVRYLVERIRNEPDSKTAGDLKRRLPAMCCAFVRGGRKLENMVTKANILYIDVDIANPDKQKVEAMRDSLKNEPSCIGAHLTARCGLRIYVCVPTIDLSLYKDLYKAVAAHFSTLLDVEYDSSCSDPLRLTYASWDPSAWWRDPSSEEFIMFPYSATNSGPEAFSDNSDYIDNNNFCDNNYSDNNDRNNNNYYIGNNNCYSDKNHYRDSNNYYRDSNSHYRDNNNYRNYNSNYSDNPMTAATPHPSSSEADIRRFLERNLLYTPMIPGKRNESLLKLGSKFKKAGFQESDLPKLTEIMHHHYGDSEYTAKAIFERLRWGFIHHIENTSNSYKNSINEKFTNEKYINKNPVNEKFINEKFINEKFTNGKFINGKSVKNTDDELTQEEKHSIDLEVKQEEIIINYCPRLPLEDISALPGIMKDMLSLVPGGRQRDILFTALIAVLSGCTPNVEFYYGRQIMLNNLFCMCIGPAGSGKGIVTMTENIVNGIQELLDDFDRTAMIKYKEKCDEWELEKSAAGKERRIPDYRREVGEEPLRHHITTPAITSKSQIIRNLSAMNKVGTILVTTEMDSLSNTLSSDYGQFLAELRKASMNEKISIHYKTDNRPIVAEKPKLSLVITGTPEQLPIYIPAVENGTYSRHLVYITEEKRKWVSQWGDDTNNSGSHVEEVLMNTTSRIKDMFSFLYSNPTVLRFTKRQRNLLDKRFESYTEETSTEIAEEIQAIVRRHALSMLRICSTITAMLKYEAGWQVKEIQCSDEVFDFSLKLIDVYLKHSLHTLTMFPEKRKKMKPMKYFYESKIILESLNDKFNNKEWLEVLKDENISRSKGYRIKNILLCKGIIKELNKGIYEKASK